jgi:hypothetical protein
MRDVSQFERLDRGEAALKTAPPHLVEKIHNARDILFIFLQ